MLFVYDEHCLGKKQSRFLKHCILVPNLCTCSPKRIYCILLLVLMLWFWQ